MITHPAVFRRAFALLAASLLLSFAVLSSGCLVAAAGAGAGAVAYLRGDLETSLSAKFDRAARATDSALDALKFARVSGAKDAMLAVYVARNAADKRIEVRLEQAGEQVTKVKIRVGVFGDEALSLAILEKIKASL